MNARVQRVGSRARKYLGARSPEFGIEIAWRSKLLAAAGVRTPVGAYDSSTHELTFQWIAGTSGRDIAHRCFSTPKANRAPVAKTDLLRALLVPLARLHRVDGRPLRLQAVDAWRRIRPRLVAGPSRDTTFAHARRVRDRLKAIGSDLCTDIERVPIHADYHVGQLLLETPSAEPWLLDMDDVASGPREYDLGGFSAHLATDGLLNDDVQETFRKIERLVRTGYEDITGVCVDAQLTNYYGAVSLLRRALKLRECGREAIDAARILCAASGVVDDVDSGSTEIRNFVATGVR